MVLSLFDSSNDIRNEFRSLGIEALSLDHYQNRKTSRVDFNTNILDFPYKTFSKNQFKFIFIALPCTSYSIASGSFHYKKGIPQTSVSITHINILIRIWQITQYFNCPFLIENPAGGLINNPFFKTFFSLDVTRITMRSFGFPTQKKTDLFTNFNLLLLNSPVTRKNGRYQNQKLDNMGYRRRVKYPEALTKHLIQNIVSQLNLKS